MKKNRRFSIAVMVLGGVILVLGGYLVYDVFFKSEATIYTYHDLQGLYTYTTETIAEDTGDEYTAFYDLYLDENGTFTYRMGTGAPSGYIGNYVIKDDALVLNYWFRTNSGAGLTVTVGSKTLSIASGDTLVDADPSLIVGNLTSVILKKASAAEEQEYAQYDKDVSYILNNSEILREVTDQ